MNLPLLLSTLRRIGTTPVSSASTIFGAITEVNGRRLVAPYPLFPSNDLALLIKGLKYLDPVDGKAKPRNAASITAFLTTSNLPDAVTAAAALSITCPYIAGSDGDYTILFDASRLGYSVLASLFASATPFLIVQETNGFRVARQLVYTPSRLLL
jgi:hypothetical protein